MSRRIDLDNLLREIVPNNLYFQPPEGLKLKFPCIVYRMTDIDIKHANDKAYLAEKRYTITYITKNPDDDMVDTIITSLPGIKYDRTLNNEGMYHHIFSLYF